MNILIVGLGSIARKHISALQKLNFNCEIYALRSKKNCPEEDGIINLYSYSEVYKIDLAFVIISNPTSLKIDALEKLRLLKVPLFIEKPLSDSMDVQRIVDDINKDGILTYIACNLRFLDSIKFVKKYIERKNPVINEINVYCGSYLPDWRPNVDYKNGYSAKKKLGGGVHLDLIHELDYLYWIFGYPEKINRFLTNNSILGIDAVDYANYILKYNTFSASVILNYYRRDSKRTLEIIFDDDTWIVDLTLNCIKNMHNEIVFKSNQAMTDTYEAQIKYFIDTVLKKENRSMNSINDAINVLKICLENDVKK